MINMSSVCLICPAVHFQPVCILKNVQNTPIVEKQALVNCTYLSDLILVLS